MRFSILFIAFTLLFVGCRKINNKPRVDGNANCYENSILVNNYEAQYTDKGEFLQIIFAELFSFKLPRKTHYYANKSFGFLAIPKKIGKYYIKKDNFLMHRDSIKEPASYLHTYQQDGEMVCERYHINDDDVDYSFIEITNEKDNFKEVWGKFEVSY